MPLPRLAVTAGEPAGIGPELLIRLAATPLAASLVAITDRQLLKRAATRCGVSIELIDDDGSAQTERRPGSLRLRHTPLAVDETPGRPDPRNARHVLDTLAEAADGCLTGRYDAVVTAPLHKAAINDSGIPFSGHTEFLAERATRRGGDDAGDPRSARGTGDHSPAPARRLPTRSRRAAGARHAHPARRPARRNSASPSHASWSRAQPARR